MLWQKTEIEKLMDLQGERICLLPWRKRDLSQWVALRSENRDFLQPFEPLWPEDMPSATAFERRRLKFKQDAEMDQGYGFLLHLKNEKVLIGGLSLYHLRRGALHCANISYWIGQEYSRQGYMQEGLNLLLHFAFESLGLHRLEAYCLAHNHPSTALLLKAGFEHEGVARLYLRINGDWQDHHRFVKINHNA